MSLVCAHSGTFGGLGDNGIMLGWLVFHIWYVGMALVLEVGDGPSWGGEEGARGDQAHCSCQY